MRAYLPLILFVFARLDASAAPNKIPVNKLLEAMVHRSALAEPGGKPFYLRATITDSKDTKSEFNGTVEESWVSPTKWRRVIKLRDFVQTRIVNGDMIYENNIGDYFPLHDETLANEIVDPLPKSAVDLMNKLDLTATEPGEGEGQCTAEKHFTGDDGRETRVLLAYNCKTGLLVYLFSPSCCYGVMTDYRKFHDKMVAFATQDVPINIRIDALRDLDSRDDSQFAIAEPTPPAKRMTTKQVGEAEARKVITEKTDTHWPAANKKPNSGNVEVSVVIGRDGQVKEAWSYSGVDQGIKDAAVVSIRKLKFKPQNINGVPAQIETTLTIPFSVDLQGAAAAEPDVGPVFERMRSQGNLRLNGAPSFHMKASFRSEDGGSKGAYEETWFSSKKWRRELKLNDSSVIEIQTEGSFYRNFPGKFAPRLADDLIEFLSFSLPGDNANDFRDSEWSAANTKLVDMPLLRLSKGNIGPQDRLAPLTIAYFVDEKTGVIRGRYHYSNLTVFNDFQPFGQKTFARKLTMVGGDAKKMEIAIDILEPVSSVSEDIFRMSGVKPLFTSEEQDHRFTQPRSVYSPKPSTPGWHGNVKCKVKIDEHGHVRDVDIQGTSDESVLKSIRATLMSWEYEPATMNGHLAQGAVEININMF